MPGGLLNLIAYGNQNIVLNGNPTCSFSKELIRSIRTLAYKNLEWILTDKEFLSITKSLFFRSRCQGMLI